MFPKPLQKLIDEISALPGIGPRSATRIALEILKNEPVQAEKLANTIATIHSQIKPCKQCFNYSTSELCSVCQSELRSDNLIMVVESPLDILAFEKSEYKGKYHVLNGLISPMSGKGPSDLNITALVTRVGKLMESNTAVEVIVACPTSLEGEATGMFIKDRLAELKDSKSAKSKLTITELAKGIPANSGTEYLDPLTLDNSLQNRVEITN